jgi:DNA-binding HxlR family transcriptional regulator
MSPIDGDDPVCQLRAVFDRVGDKWSVLLLHLLSDGSRRHSELKRAIDGISQRMLTLTLRQLERDGLVDRTVTATVPPRVDYALTAAGRSFIDSTAHLLGWAEAHRAYVDASRRDFDRH